MPITRVTVIEDDPRFRESLGALIELSPGFERAGTFPDAESALSAADSAWDLVLMDIELPGMNGIDATRELKLRVPHVRVVVITVFEDPATILRSICAGADGYLTKGTPAEELLHQLRYIMAGGAPLSAGVARTLLGMVRDGNEPTPSHGPRVDAGLTAREREVLDCLVDGLPYKQVAARLGISIETVRTHIRSVYSKLQVHSVVEAVTLALRNGLR
jgi:DNA-binding NarL/FixJ family response regulator